MVGAADTVKAEGDETPQAMSGNPGKSEVDASGADGTGKAQSPSSTIAAAAASDAPPDDESCADVAGGKDFSATAVASDGSDKNQEDGATVADTDAAGAEKDGGGPKADGETAAVDASGPSSSSSAAADSSETGASSAGETGETSRGAEGIPGTAPDGKRTGRSTTTASSAAAETSSVNGKEQRASGRSQHGKGSASERKGKAAGSKGGEERKKGPPVFLFFSVHQSGQFCGAAELMGPLENAGAKKVCIGMKLSFFLGGGEDRRVLSICCRLFFC